MTPTLGSRMVMPHRALVKWLKEEREVRLDAAEVAHDPMDVDFVPEDETENVQYTVPVLYQLDGARIKGMPKSWGAQITSHMMRPLGQKRGVAW